MNIFKNKDKRLEKIVVVLSILGIVAFTIIYIKIEINKEIVKEDITKDMYKCTTDRVNKYLQDDKQK